LADNWLSLFLSNMGFMQKTLNRLII